MLILFTDLWNKIIFIESGANACEYLLDCGHVVVVGSRGLVGLAQREGERLDDGGGTGQVI